MRLTDDEIVALKKQKPCKAWRLEKPKYAEEGKSYTSASVTYTVLAVEQLSDGDVLRRFGKSEYEKQREDHGPSWRALWLIVIVAGDRTDQPRYLAHAGMGDERDYSRRQRRTKTGRETTMLDEPTVSDEVLAQFARAANATTEDKQTKRQLKQRARTRLRDAKKALDAIR